MKFIHTRFWPIWCFVGLIYLVAKFPFHWQMDFGAWCVRLVKHISKKRVEIAKTNLSRCFLELTEDERREILDHHFELFGKVPL